MFAQQEYRSDAHRHPAETSSTSRNENEFAEAYGECPVVSASYPDVSL
jgi:hypothetical protein